MYSLQWPSNWENHSGERSAKIHSANPAKPESANQSLKRPIRSCRTLSWLSRTYSKWIRDQELQWSKSPVHSETSISESSHSYTMMAGRLIREMPVPTSRSVIENKFKKHILTAESVEIKKEMQCAVCKDHLAPGEEIYETTCAHTFHTACLDPWLQMSNRCPTCRSVFN